MRKGRNGAHTTCIDKVHHLTHKVQPFPRSLPLHCFPIDEDMWSMARPSVWPDLILHGDTTPLAWLAQALHHLETV